MDREVLCERGVCVYTCVWEAGMGVFYTVLHPEAQRRSPCFLPWACGQQTHQPVVSGTLRATTLDPGPVPWFQHFMPLEGSHRLSPHKGEGS